MKTLGIETSCDETAIGVVEDGTRLITSIVSSQVELHAEYGGVVPELASRKHVEAMIPVLDEALSAAACGLTGLDAIAVTYGPGLSGALLVGLNFAKALAFSLGLPLVPVNHLEGHIYAAWLKRDPADPQDEGPRFPSLVLIVSGGHSDIVLMADHGRYRRLGQTVDDAAGEAFDKVARLLGLGFPGGPAIDRLTAKHGRAKTLRLPRARLDGEYDFSFSGLKAKVQRIVRGEEGHSPQAAELAAAFQESVVDSLVTKALEAAANHGAREIILAGGVAANSELRRVLAERSPVPIVVPPPALCTDNGAMIAACAHYRLASGDVATLDLDIDPALQIG
ncbi:MAG: tRNA (adenosine(37)-N6)-threonylcarbamoyltransferase complex transferase subunit TsaD [Chloroflexi bacterium]|nr:tRNA (adenosine(37)-N6)-threonylcarbamoyltransferase complex transferase subunit TsaD [Chloroflexota bacterium]MCI0886153.1 tRNA (adenosine(37)-N6)-threonylcarbamoyltransferase complex transferase subunit TsaD [Chloroflexota bacterium]